VIVSVAALMFILAAALGFLATGCGQPALAEVNLNYGETATRNGLEITFGKPVHRPGFTYEGKERWEGSYRVVGGHEDVYFTQDDFLIVDSSGKTYQCVGASPRPDPEVPPG
jgi:L-ascorbate metabolism protein UlaG (beta-lactamase superfamily)